MNFKLLDLNFLYWPCGRGTSIGSQVAVICCVLQGRLLLRAADGRLWYPGHSVDVGPCFSFLVVFLTRHFPCLPLAPEE